KAEFAVLHDGIPRWSRGRASALFSGGACLSLTRHSPAPACFSNMDRTVGRREREAGMRRDWLELGFGLLIALAVSRPTPPGQAQPLGRRSASTGRVGTMRAFPCGPAIQPNAPSAVSGIRAAAPGPFPIP